MPKSGTVHSVAAAAVDALHEPKKSSAWVLGPKWPRKQGLSCYRMPFCLSIWKTPSRSLVWKENESIDLGELLRTFGIIV
jgi:hypothetical protein